MTSTTLAALLQATSLCEDVHPDECDKNTSIVVPDEETPAQRVLRIPLLLGTVIWNAGFVENEWTERESYDQDWDTIRNCLLVNHLWFYETAKILWGMPSYRSFCIYPINGIHEDLTYRFKNLEAPRRQLYANFVRRAHFYLDADLPLDNEGITDVVFPLLEHVTIYMNSYAPLPRLRGHAVRWLDIDPYYETCGLSCNCQYHVPEEDWSALLDDIVDNYPKLEQISVDDDARAYPGTIAHTYARLPCLRSFNGLEESAGDPNVDRS